MVDPTIAETVSNVVAFYLPVIVASIAQLAFLVLPVALQNWEDDSLNVLTYVGIQVFMGSLIFVVVPTVLGIFTIGFSRAFVILLIVFVTACVRAYRIIPLEGTAPVVAKTETVRQVDFVEFYSNLRLRTLAELSANRGDGAERIRDIKERLARKRPERADRAALASK